MEYTEKKLCTKLVWFQDQVSWKLVQSEPKSSMCIHRHNKAASHNFANTPKKVKPESGQQKSEYSPSKA